MLAFSSCSLGHLSPLQFATHNEDNPLPAGRAWLHKLLDRVDRHWVDLAVLRDRHSLFHHCRRGAAAAMMQFPRLHVSAVKPGTFISCLLRLGPNDAMSRANRINRQAIGFAASESCALPLSG